MNPLLRPWHIGLSEENGVTPIWCDTGLNAMGSRARVGLANNRKLAEHIVSVHNDTLPQEPTNKELWT